ncbi:LOB domain-containing protein 25-like [Curcuma longa]|uniref:LOB domain-containing protein 25-like n=1 Tax=Curcuma longa TaxID=136217 RepID=UPI003D9ED4E8
MASSPSSSSSSGSSYNNSPCAACKFLRRKCMAGCIFAPYFPPEEPQRFANVHRIFGASNVAKLLNELLPHQREDAVSSLAYEAEARVKDPVYGCVAVISLLQRQLDVLRSELDAANADLLRYATAAGAAAVANVQLPISSSFAPIAGQTGGAGGHYSTDGADDDLFHDHDRVNAVAEVAALPTTPPPPWPTTKINSPVFDRARRNCGDGDDQERKHM